MPRRGCRVIGIVIPNELDEELRSVIPGKKGALSEFVVEAIREKLERIRA